jgi:hypothetical protein
MGAFWRGTPRKTGGWGRVKDNDYLCVPHDERMKILVEIPDNRAAALLEVLRSMSFVKARPLTEGHVKLLNELQEAAEEVREVKSGKKKGKTLQRFLNEL